MKKRKCEFCGKSISSEDIFCKGCGNKIVDEEVKDAVIDDRPREGSGFYLAIIVFLLLVIVSLGTYYLFFK